MYLFIACIALLYLCSLFTETNVVNFKKEKVIPLKAILALLIILHHISLENTITWLSPLKSWGAPIVSIFLFISGYGLMMSYNKFGGGYLSGFVKHRIIDAITLSFLLTSLLYWCIVPDLPRIVESVRLLITKGVVLLPHSWYVFAILILYTTFYISCKFMSGVNVLIMLTTLCVAYIITTSQLGYARCWYISALAFPAGAVYAYWAKDFSNNVSKKTWWFIPLCVLFAALLYFTHSELGYMLVYVLIPFMVVYLCSILNIDKLGNIKLFRWLSAISYEIYLCQGIALYLAGKVVVDSSLLYVLFVFILTFAFAYIVKESKLFILNRCN